MLKKLSIITASLIIGAWSCVPYSAPADNGDIGTPVVLDAPVDYPTVGLDCDAGSNRYWSTDHWTCRAVTVYPVVAP